MIEAIECSVCNWQRSVVCAADKVCLGLSIDLVNGVPPSWLLLVLTFPQRMRRRRHRNHFRDRALCFRIPQ